ncbi:MAG: Bax inhibitor-1/YccA family protein [Rickettsiaceae bacterium]|jgi:FtsH-binding integral membrane protein|uniref:Bax inhibitor-1/YccA family protein n=1 Tax=Candidatus Megaera polyxenophila TaxID=988779 RepID=UPI001B4A5357|nr:Bax inhibitor-1/YccA family protein [Candidatus Megaera polyxenophila]MBP9777814.1 Bax inhibitor-1/YccA family protein [Rickettsiaceae bacterium]MBU6184272.1 Bax inhibitor-1/YccA family protein [Rickettsiales bacterium]NBU53019.1 Bax inhibitor-1/YccA family protein [Alphaproteobacteria bacterium]UCM93762.1 MAG: Bax inhibitor-1/YccA family protein [Candidatus Megaira endosymbiont of Mesostigma viride]HJK85699.1 Bax inhibitor-1/YccA family protein [Candidatus Megaera endosymbiont of Stentor r
MIDYTKSFVKDKGSFDEGLRNYMLKIYNFMAIGLLVTGVFAFSTLNFPPLASLMFNIGPNGEFMGTSGLGMLISFAPLGIAIYFFMGLGRMSVNTAQTLFWVYAAVMGMSLSYLGLVYTGQSLARTFFICASVFGAMSLYGYSTKSDLTSMGSFLIMGLIGLIVVSLVNIFLRSPAIDFATSFIGIAIFMGLTAWDTQKLKTIYYSSGGGEMGQKMAVMGAFTLYLDFINLFLYMLRFFGDRK